MGTESIQSDETLYWDDDEHLLIAKFLKHRLIKSVLRPNTAPLRDKWKLVKLGESERGVMTDFGEPGSSDSHVDASGTKKQWYYWQGMSPRRTLEIVFVNGRVASRRYGPDGVPYRGLPWEKGWKPINDPPF